VSTHALSPAQRTVYKDRPSWNHQPKRDWDGPDLPELPPSEASNTLFDTLDQELHA
jgi:hypothetical protein